MKHSLPSLWEGLGVNGLDDLVWTMNFGTGANIDKQFDRLKQLRPNAPLMCSEFWSGWFDKWGARHETRPAKDMVEGMDEMLSKNISFSLYMTHGGTSFGHWAGANSPGFAPDVTSYDYDAPINEYGQPTPKYYELREMMKKYAEKKLPAVPKPAAPIITIPKGDAHQRLSDGPAPEPRCAHDGRHGLRMGYDRIYHDATGSDGKERTDTQRLSRLCHGVCGRKVYRED